MSLFLLLQQCPVCLVRLTWMVSEIGGWWPYSCCFVGCWFQDLFDITRSILVQFPFSFLSVRFVSVHVVHPYRNMDTTAAWKKVCFILSDRLDFYMINYLSIAVNAFGSRLFMSLSVDPIYQPLRSGRIWHKVKFLSGVNRFEFKVFLLLD